MGHEKAQSISSVWVWFHISTLQQCPEAVMAHTSPRIRCGDSDSVTKLAIFGLAVIRPESLARVNEPRQGCFSD